MNKQVPIKGTVVGSDTFNAFDPGCVYDPPVAVGWLPYRFITKGAGTVSHLGKVDFVLDNCSMLDLDSPAGVIAYGTITFTAANGDVLVIAHKGTSKATSPTDYTAQYTWEVVGDEGTGRFDGATGKGTAIGLTRVPDETTEGGSKITLRGKIAYDASNRSNR